MLFNLKNALKVSVLFVGILSFSTIASADLGISSAGVTLSYNDIYEGSPVRIYASVTNSGADAKANVRFFLDSEAVRIGSDQSVSVLSGGSDIAFVDLYPPKGQHQILVKLIPWEPDNASNNYATRAINVKADNDRDKIADELDNDDDNDGVEDSKDRFPLDKNESIDSDDDGIGNNADPDDDNDGTIDTDDVLPLDPTETKDKDGDGIGDNADPDDDGDNLDDLEEEILGLDNNNPDTDGDGVLDGDDAFPFDKSESSDLDRDGIGNVADNDDDGDLVYDDFDPKPQNHGPKIRKKLSLIKLENLKINFDARRSLDPDGKIVKTIWYFGDIKKEGAFTSHVFQGAGGKTVVLEVYDNDGEGRRQTFEIKVWNLSVALSVGFILIVVMLAIGISFVYSLRNSRA